MYLALSCRFVFAYLCWVADLRDYFHAFGDVIQAWFEIDPVSGERIGFVKYADSGVIDRVLAIQTSPQPHQIFGRQLDVRLAQQGQGKTPPLKPTAIPVAQASSVQSIQADQAVDAGKIFVGGLHVEATEADVRQQFSVFGDVIEVLMMYDRLTQRSRGFAFVTFADPASALLAEQKQHQVRFFGKKVDILAMHVCVYIILSR